MQSVMAYWKKHYVVDRVMKARGVQRDRQQQKGWFTAWKTLVRQNRLLLCYQEQTRQSRVQGAFDALACECQDNKREKRHLLIAHEFKRQSIQSKVLKGLKAVYLLYKPDHREPADSILALRHYEQALQKRVFR